MSPARGPGRQDQHSSGKSRLRRVSSAAIEALSSPVTLEPAPMRSASSRGVLILTAATTLFVGSPGATSAAPDDPFADFDAHASQALGDWKVPAMAIAVVKDGRVVFARGYGVRKLGG